MHLGILATVVLFGPSREAAADSDAELVAEMERLINDDLARAGQLIELAPQCDLPTLSDMSGWLPASDWPTASVPLVPTDFQWHERNDGLLSGGSSRLTITLEFGHWGCKSFLAEERPDACRTFIGGYPVLVLYPLEAKPDTAIVWPYNAGALDGAYASGGVLYRASGLRDDEARREFFSIIRTAFGLRRIDGSKSKERCCAKLIVEHVARSRVYPDAQRRSSCSAVASIANCGVRDLVIPVSLAADEGRGADVLLSWRPLRGGRGIARSAVSESFCLAKPERATLSLICVPEGFAQDLPWTPSLPKGDGQYRLHYVSTGGSRSVGSPSPCAGVSERSAASPHCVNRLTSNTLSSISDD